MIHKNLGRSRSRASYTAADAALLAPRPRPASSRSATCSRTHRQKQAVGEAMRVVGEANKYLSDQAPWKLKNERPGADEDGAARCGAGDLGLPDACCRRSCRTARRRCTRRSAAPGPSRRCRRSARSTTWTAARATRSCMGDYPAGTPTVAPVAVGADRAGHAGPGADAGLPQARRLRWWTRSWPGWRKRPGSAPQARSPAGTRISDSRPDRTTCEAPVASERWTVRPGPAQQGSAGPPAVRFPSGCRPSGSPAIRRAAGPGTAPGPPRPAPASRPPGACRAGRPR